MERRFTWATIPHKRSIRRRSETIQATRHWGTSPRLKALDFAHKQDRLRGQYHALSADPNSLANLDQDLPNSMQDQIPIFTLDQDWLWCQTWCSDESLATAKTSEWISRSGLDPKLTWTSRPLSKSVNERAKIGSSTTDPRVGHI